jgi:hypothetical protein
MDVTTVNLIIIILTVAILSGIAHSLSSRAYRRSAALVAAFVLPMPLWRSLPRPVARAGLHRAAGIRIHPIRKVPATMKTAVQTPALKDTTTRSAITRLSARSSQALAYLLLT